MPKAAVAGGEIWYEESGAGDPLILVSGLNGQGNSWRAQVAAFAPHFRVITYDQRGTGQSDRLQRAFSVDQMALELAGLMDALGIARAHLVGHSTGGAISQTLAIEQPQRVGRMVLSSSWTHCDPWFRRLFEARRELYRQAGPEVHVLFHPLFLYPPQWVVEHDEEIAAEQRRARVHPSPVEVSIGRIEALLAFDRRAGLAGIRTPTLVVGADNDYITPAYFSEALARAIPGAQLHIAKGVGHSFNKTDTSAFNRLVLGFLQAS